MSPKNSSLAYEEQVETFSEMENDYLSELSLVLKVRKGCESEDFTEESIRISGSLTVSF